MKKFTLMLLAALISVGAMAQSTSAIELKKKNTAEHSLSVKESNKEFKVHSLSATQSESLSKRAQKVQAQRTADIESTDQLVGTYVQKYYSYFDDAYAFSTVTISKGEDDNTIILSGWWGSWAEDLEATVDFENSTISIPFGQAIYEYEGDTPATFVNLYNNDDTALLGTINEKTITFAGGWGAQLNGGSNFYVIGLENTLTKSNGLMTYSYQNQKISAYVLLTQSEDAKKVTVENFADFGATIDINLKADHTFAIPSQQIQGDYYTYAATATGIAGTTITGTGTETELVFGSNWTAYDGGTSWYGSRGPATITYLDGTLFRYPAEVVDIAAIPANPQNIIYAVTQSGPATQFEIPLKDINGEDLREDKLFYQLYIDIEKEVSPLTLSPDDYLYLTEPLSIIPYSFTDEYDIYSREDVKTIFFYNSDSWNKFGVKSIYTGGGETNETEIQWYTIKKYAVDIAREALEAEIKTAEDLLADETKTLGVEEFTEAINDAKALLNNEEATADELNAGVTALKEAEAAFILANKDPYEREVTWVASEQGYSNSQKITEFALDENISATVEKGNGTTDPAYYTQGTALRLYAKNSLTINANEDVTKITTIEFTTPSTGQNRGNNISSVPTGYSFLDSTGSWTGEATSVVFTQGGNNGHARISKIFVVYKLKESVVDGINNITINNDAHYFDLQGRVATNATKGLLIKQVRDAQGNVKTVKVVRK